MTTFETGSNLREWVMFLDTEFAQIMMMMIGLSIALVVNMKLVDYYDRRKASGGGSASGAATASSGLPAKSMSTNVDTAGGVGTVDMTTVTSGSKRKRKPKLKSKSVGRSKRKTKGEKAVRQYEDTRTKIMPTVPSRTTENR